MDDPPPRRTPHPALRGLVALTGYHARMAAPGVHHGLPSTALTAILAFDEPIDVSWPHDRERGRHRAMVSGLHAGPALIHYDRVQHGIQLDVTPFGARALLGVTAASLAGRLVPLADVLGAAADDLYDDVAGAPTWTRRFDLLEQHLLDRLGRDAASGIGPELTRAWGLVRRTRGRVRVADLAEDVGWSRRHLTERFTGEFGVGPKQAARIERFQRARLLLAGDRRIADIAAFCGYADHAHLTHEFRELGGCTPTEWRSDRLSFVQDADVVG